VHLLSLWCASDDDDDDDDNDDDDDDNQHGQSTLLKRTNSKHCSLRAIRYIKFLVTSTNIQFYSLIYILYFNLQLRVSA